MKAQRKKLTNNKTEILLVEDSLTQAEQIRHLLESHYYKVSVAQNGKQALDQLSKHKPTLVISDIVMPEMNGYELCKKIKFNKNTADIPVILLTRLTDTEEIIEGLSCGADSFITKPYNEKHLISNIENFLSEGNREDQKKVPFGAQILFKGKKRFIQAEQQNVIKLMLDIYEGAIHQNERLVQTQEELRLLNERLESLVEDRTSDLTEEIKLSNQITKSLKESEEKWRTLVTTIPEYIGLVDCKGKFLFLNHYAEGFSEKDTIGKSHLHFIPNEWKEFYRQKFEKCINTQKNQIFEYTAFGDNKTLRTYETCLVPVIRQGKVSNVMAIARDITERKLAEETISILAKFPSENPDPVLRVDMNGRLLYANEASYKVMTWKLQIGEKTSSVLQKVIAEAMKGGIRKIIDTEHGQRIISFNIVPVLEAGYANLYGRDITERKQVEEVLKESESSLRNAQEIAKMGSWEWNLVTQKTSWSDNYFVIHGFKPDEIEPSFELFRNRIHPDDVHLLDETHASVLKDRKPISFELRLIQPDGTVKWIQNNISPVVTDDKLVKLKGVIIDITERKKVEDILKSSEERLKILFDYAPDAYYLNDLRGNLIDGNIAAEKLLGLNKNELIGKSFLKLNLLSLTQIPRAAKLLVKNALGLGTGPDEFVLSRKDGSKVTVEIITHPVKIKDQTLVLGLARDITNRKLAEEKIIHERRMLRTLIDNLPDHIYVKDSEGRKLISNIADFKDLGLQSEEQVIGKTDLELFPGHTGQRGYADDMEVITSGNAIMAREEDFINSRGEIRWSFATKIPLHDKDGKITGLVGIGHDITKRKEREEELKRAKEKAEESERLKSAFLTNMSHEIRTPMNGIIGFTELLKEPNLTVGEQQDFIQTIGISGARMLSTINNIVDMSRIEAGMIKSDIKETNINEKIEFTYKFFKPEVEIKGLQFLLKTGLPSKEAIITTDNEKIYAILTNLVKNAIKFTYKGSIEFGYEKKDKYLEFFVKDTGVGIPQNQKELIFERFRQGSESINREYEGSGLGLSICKSYVEMLGGKIWVESEEGKGSIFYFTIPYNAVSEQTSAIENAIFTENKEVQIKKLKILIVEDDEISYSLLTRTLQKISKEVLHAITGVEAVEACQKNPDIDLVFMDIRMPRMNGLEATQQIRQFNKDVIIIAQTAYGFSGDCEKALEAGCNDYIAKPINKTLLYEVIKKHCNK